MEAQQIDGDLIELEQAIRVEGVSPWVAAGRVFQSGITQRSRSTLYYHARKIVKSLRDEADPYVTSTVSALLAGDDVLVKKDMAQAVKNVLLRDGHEWYESPRFGVLIRLCRD